MRASQASTAARVGGSSWASPPVTRVQDMQDWWIRDQQWSAISGDALRMLGDIDGWQVYYWRLNDNNWSNAQSSGDVAPVPPAPPAAPGTRRYELRELATGRVQAWADMQSASFSPASI